MCIVRIPDVRRKDRVARPVSVNSPGLAGNFTLRILHMHISPFYCIYFVLHLSYDRGC
jgi:hypothetical protein